jgi:hypothetical protein
MFKAMRDGLRAASVSKAMEIAGHAIVAGNMQVADAQLEKAYNLCLDTKFPRNVLNELMLQWGLIGVMVSEKGFPELAAHCRKMSDLLQSRLQAGDHYTDA